MPELIVSMMRFSAAMTLFGMQQIQNAIGAATDTQAAITRFKNSMDSMADAVASHMSESNRATLDSVSRAQSHVVNRTLDAVNADTLDPRGMMRSTEDLMRKTSDSLSTFVTKAAAGR